MHSTIKGPSLIKRSSELPRMSWSLSRLRLVLLLPALLAVVVLLLRERWGLPKQRRRIQRQHKTEVVESRLVCGVHAC
jgi:hypothetical protein